MIISILTILIIITLHLFPKTIREKAIYRLKRFFVKLRALIKNGKYSATL